VWWLPRTAISDLLCFTFVCTYCKVFTVLIVIEELHTQLYWLIIILGDWVWVFSLSSQLCSLWQNCCHQMHSVGFKTHQNRLPLDPSTFYHPRLMTSCLSVSYGIDWHKQLDPAVLITHGWWEWLAVCNGIDWHSLFHYLHFAFIVTVYICLSVCLSCLLLVIQRLHTFTVYIWHPQTFFSHRCLFKFFYILTVAVHIVYTGSLK